MPKQRGSAQKKKAGAAKSARSGASTKRSPKSAPKPSKAKKPVPAKPAAKPAPSTGGSKKVVRKGITIVSNKPLKKPRAKPTPTVIPNFGSALIKPGGPKRKPLILSGPNAPALGTRGTGGPVLKPAKRGAFDKKQLAQFKAILLRKRAELAGDVTTMENEALMGQSGALSHLPQHMAEQGSDAYGQSLSLDLAAADRRLIKEIDDALSRIAAGTYGVCELTGRPIRAERLEELPWARYSIEAARELERRSRLP